MVGDSERDPLYPNIYVPASCTSRVVGDLTRDPQHSETIHPDVGEACIHASTPQPSNDHPQPKNPINQSTHTTTTREEVYKEGLTPPWSTSLLIERSVRFPDYSLLRFRWQRRALLCLHRITSLPTISSTSPCRLQPIYYSCVSATIRLCKILVHTPSFAPLPIARGPGHTIIDKRTITEKHRLSKMPSTNSSWGEAIATHLAQAKASKQGHQDGAYAAFTKPGFAYARFPLQASPKQIREANHLMLQQGYCYLCLFAIKYRR